jgi:TPR repeat protein
VEALKSGLRAQRPGFLLLAGMMHDEGMCVKADWEKAVNLYMLALEAGSQTAAPRLVAGYARPGRDNGLALWWVAKSRVTAAFPRQCIPQADPEHDLDGFNAGLEAMPPATFKACVYLVGVVAAVHAEREFPQLALQHGVTGTYTMTFDPARGAIAWQQDALEINENKGNWARDLAQEDLENPRKIRDSLLAYLKRKGEFALTRYPKPDGGLPPDYVYKSSFYFAIE